jgi:hypothetical protein
MKILVASLSGTTFFHFLQAETVFDREHSLEHFKDVNFAYVDASM